MEPTPSSPLDAVRANEQILGVMLVVHGAIHLIGFVLAWRLFEPLGFAYDQVWPDAGTGPGRVVGVAWLATAAGLAVVGARLANRRQPRARELVVVLSASVILCLLSSPAALPGAAFSGLVLAVMLVIRVRRARASRTLGPGRPGTHLKGSEP